MESVFPPCKRIYRIRYHNIFRWTDFVLQQELSYFLSRNCHLHKTECIAFDVKDVSALSKNFYFQSYATKDDVVSYFICSRTINGLFYNFYRSMRSLCLVKT